MLQQAIGGVEGEIRVAMQYFFQAMGARGPAKYRDMLIASTVDDLILTRAITGVAANWLKPSIERAGYDLDAMEKNPDIDFTDPQSGAKRWAQVWSAGHGVGTIDRVEPVAALVARLREEYARAKQR